MRLRHVKNAFDIIENNRDIAIENPENYKGKWRESFNKSQDSSLSVEVGCGKGKFLSTMSEENKNDLFIGLEMMSSVICRAITKVKEKELTNCLILNKDCEHILDYFNEGEVDRIYINFPDPWPKLRHEKRRLTSPRFLEKYKTILKEDGILRFKTDNLDLYNYSLETILPLLKDDKRFGEVEYSSDTIMTEFESKFKEMGNPIYFIEGSFK